MKKSLMERIGQIIAGNAHALIDAIEGAAPAASAERALIGIERLIDEARRELGLCTAARHTAEQQLERLAAEHAELEAQAEAAVRMGPGERADELARAALSRMADLEKQFPVLRETIDRSAEDERQHGLYIEALLAKRRELQGASAGGLVSGGDHELGARLAELDRLGREQQVDARLAELKAKLSK